jgi:hypothetical protein
LLRRALATDYFLSYAAHGVLIPVFERHLLSDGQPDAADFQRIALFERRKD